MLLITFGMEMLITFRNGKETGDEIILKMTFSFTGEPNIILSM